MERLGTTSAAATGAAYTITPAQSSAGTATNVHQRRVLVLPAWARHGTQPNYWSEVWFRKERLADWDRIAGTVYEADNIDDVIAHLHRASDAAEAE